MTRSKITILDVAREAGVSKSTVSLVLTGKHRVRDQTRLKVTAAMEKLGYVYNRDAASLRSQRSKLVGVLVNDLTDPLSTALALAASQLLSARGLHPWLHSSEESPKQQSHICELYKERKVDALLLIPARGSTTDWLDEISRDWPVVQMLREVPFVNAPSVLPDHRKGIHLVTTHLLEQGATHLALLGGDEGEQEQQARRSEFEASLTRQAIAFTLLPGLHGRHGGRQALAPLLDIKAASLGVVCHDDLLAAGLCEAMLASGLIPGKDIKVVGCGDFADSALQRPALSSLHVDVDEIAKRSVDMLLEQLEGGSVPLRTQVDIGLRARASSSPR